MRLISQLAASNSELIDSRSGSVISFRSDPDFKKNMRNPLLAMFYGFSVTACMSSALSAPDGAGLGTLGFNPEVAEQMVSAAGFSRFKLHDVEDPSNLYYEVRP